MTYERYGRGDDEYRRDQGSDRQGGRDYYGAGELGGYDRDRGGSYAQRDQGRRDDAPRGYGAPDYGQRGRGFGDADGGRWTAGTAYRGGQSYGYGDQDRYRYRDRFAGAQGDRTQGAYRGDRADGGRGGDDRGFFERAGDEVRSWFGDEQAERRREQDARYDERTGRSAGDVRDHHYHDWRDQQIASFDRDYHEYRQENRQKFHNEFSSWRTERQGQRDLLARVTEHLEVVGSDGEHVGTVDKVRDDRVILTKSDADAGGRHHSFPSRWLRSVEGGRATLTKTAAEAKQQWQDEERQGAMFGGQQQADTARTTGQPGATDPSRSVAGTY